MVYFDSASAVRRFRELSPKVPLRSADAIHLVSAHQHGLDAVYTNDARVLAAASTSTFSCRQSDTTCCLLC